MLAFLLAKLNIPYRIVFAVNALLPYIGDGCTKSKRLTRVADLTSIKGTACLVTTSAAVINWQCELVSRRWRVTRPLQRQQ